MSINFGRGTALSECFSSYPLKYEVLVWSCWKWIMYRLPNTDFTLWVSFCIFVLFVCICSILFHCILLTTFLVNKCIIAFVDFDSGCGWKLHRCDQDPEWRQTASVLSQRGTLQTWGGYFWFTLLCVRYCQTLGLSVLSDATIYKVLLRRNIKH